MEGGGGGLVVSTRGFGTLYDDWWYFQKRNVLELAFGRIHRFMQRGLCGIVYHNTRLTCTGLDEKSVVLLDSNWGVGTWMFQMIMFYEIL